MIMALAVFAFVITRDDKIYGPDDCQYICGVLSENPRESNGEAGIYVQVKVVGYPDAYRFTSCSYSDRIVSIVGKLTSGDSICLYANEQSILAASIPGKETLLDFEDFNACNDYQTNRSFPVLVGVFMLWGVFRFITTFRDERSKRVLSELAPPATFGDATGETVLRPDPIAFILRHAAAPSFFVGLGVWLNREAMPGDLDIFGLITLGVGLYLAINAFIRSERTLYVVGQAGIRIYEQSMFLKVKEMIISFSDVKEIKYRQAFYEMGRGVGTVFIDDGDKDSDGNTVYAKLVGIANYREIARLIQQRVDSQRTYPTSQML